MAAPEPGPAAQAPRRAAAWRWVWIGAVVALLAAVTAIAAASWHFSSVVLVPDHSPWSEKVEIEAVGRGEIVVERSQATQRPGRYGLVWQAGHAIVGPILEEGEETVRRRLSDVRGYLVPGTDAGLESDVYAGDPRQSLGLRFRSVRVEGELGPMPAWHIPAPGAADAVRTWAIVVHGINGDPRIGLRIAPALRRAGMSSLLIAYRNDLGAPSSPDGLHHLGLTEWRDLQAAARFALDSGAKRLVLVGYSMGGAVVSQFMQRSPLARRVAALVLDAPALDWSEAIEFNATEMGLPGLAAMPVRWAIGMRIDVDWESLDAERHPRDFELPILLFHGEEDSVVPISTSERFARELSGHVTYYAVPEAEHIGAWNVDPTSYERRLLRFLDRALGGGATAERGQRHKKGRPDGRPK